MQNKTRTIHWVSLGLSLTLALGVILAMVSLLSAAPATALTAEITVCPAGPPACEYSSIQAAVDAANDGDVVKVAAGTYTGVQGHPAPTWYDGPSVITQVVYLNKTVTIRGGYTTAFSEPPDPEANPTTLDAQGQGRVLLIAGDPSASSGQVPSASSGQVPSASSGQVPSASPGQALSALPPGKQAITPTIEGLRITGGNAAGLGGSTTDYSGDVGGGVYVIGAKVTFSNTRLFSNTACHGGGLYLYRSPAILLIGNFVSDNAATCGQRFAYGGGLLLDLSSATLSGNTIVSNTADGGGGLELMGSTTTLISNTIAFNSGGSGGGLLLAFSYAALISNTITSNSGEGLLLSISHAMLSDNTITSNSGGGLNLAASTATLSGNTISHNTTSWRGGGLDMWGSSVTLNSNIISSNSGTGLYLYDSTATFSGNTITSNSGTGLDLDDSTAILTGNTISFNSYSGLGLDGGTATLVSNTISSNSNVGLYLVRSDVTLSANTISSNSNRGLYLSDSTATLVGNTISSNFGGGLYLAWSNAMLSANTISSNTAGYGGGLYLFQSDATLINDVIAGNQAGSAGSGLYIRNSSSRLLHTTIACNIASGDGDGSGIHLASGSVAMTNTILVSHTLGITVAPGSTARLEATLWGSGAWANGTDWGGDGTIITGTINLWDDPAFVDPTAGDYHIRSTSAARNAGIDAGVTPFRLQDIDGQPRPMDREYDIGADEYPGVGLDIAKQPKTTFVNRGQVLTYTILVTNIGTMNASGVVLTGTLDGWQQPITATPSAGGCSVADGDWGGSVVCTHDTLVANTTLVITLTAQVSTSTRLGQVMTNTVIARANETTNSARFTTYAHDCYVRINDDPTGYTTVQAAVDMASPGDLVKVAGYCIGVAPPQSPPRAGGMPAGQGGLLRQQVYLDKSLTIRGGYTTTNWITPDPEANSTTLDALGQGRVLYITAPAPGGLSALPSVAGISPTIEGLRLTGGDATGLGDGDCGGGVYIAATPANVQSNRVFSNTALCGGGLYLQASDATLGGNTIISNTAHGTEEPSWGGGGLYLAWSNAMLSGNTISNNTAGASIPGGGLFLRGGPPMLNGNTISHNTADYGGGLFLMFCPATLIGNTISHNTADYDGGLELGYSDATLINNVIVGNRAKYASGWTGGSGSGMTIYESSPRLLHTTIARNTGGSGSGVYVDYSSSVAMTNTILVSQAVGIAVVAGSTARLEATLWGSGAWANKADWGGEGTIITGSVNIWGDPAFIDADGGDYHIGSTSAARNAGVDAGVKQDIDGQLRPMDREYDIGADEYPGVGLDVAKQPKATFVNRGQVLTYTILVTNIEAMDATGVVLTDTLDNWQRPITAVPSLGECSVTDGGWGGTVVCTSSTLVAGTTLMITLTARVSTSTRLGQVISNTVTVMANETMNSAQVGNTVHDCHARVNDDPTEYTTVQAAVDAASPGDLVKVAGYCTGVAPPQSPPRAGGMPAGQGGPRQQVYLDKSLTIRGGYTTTNWIMPDSEVNPTTLDALGQGRVLYITAPAPGVGISPTIEGLRITGGDATGLGDGDCGGGVYVATVPANVQSNRVFSNTALCGGGLYLQASDATLGGNIIVSNTAGEGGAGLVLSSSTATLTSNILSHNTAGLNGGGLYLWESDVILSDNAVSHNTANENGGGLYAYSGIAVFTSNTLSHNAAGWSGGGVYLWSSDATLSGNAIVSNTTTYESGGGLYLLNSPATLIDNTISDNAGGLYGGGVYLWDSDATLSGTTITSNTANENGGGLCVRSSIAVVISNTLSHNTTGGSGGGLYLESSSVTLGATTITSNTANENGGGLYLWASDVILSDNAVSHNTANENGGGLYVYPGSGIIAVFTSNTLSHNAAGGSGGGLYLEGGDVTLSDNTIVSNTAIYGSGGGLYLSNSPATLSGNAIVSNTTTYESGGGLYLSNSPATLIDNTISGNAGGVDGGGAYLFESPATLSDNTIGSNTTSGAGGGVYLYGSDATLSGNAIVSNTAIYESGGGLYLWNSPAMLIDNTISGNAGGGDGGGVCLYHSPATLSGNTISNNTAYGYGGGLHLEWSDATLRGETISSNTATYEGGGADIWFSHVTLTSTVVVENQASAVGNGLCIIGSSLRLLHVTLARNIAIGDGDGSGVYVTEQEWEGTTHYSTIALTNTILVSHAVGITVAAGSTATLEATLWGSGNWANDTDWGGAGNITTGTINIWDDPAFIVPDAGDYHIGLGSAAIDTGIDAGVSDDIDGESRPNGSGYDIGADEFYFRSALKVTKQADPNPVQPGAQLTYTIRITNTGNVDLHATVTDTLPAQATTGTTPGVTTFLPGGMITWTGVTLAPGGVWTYSFVVTVKAKYSGTLINVVEVTTEEGVTGIYTETSKVTVEEIQPRIYLPVVLKNR